MAVSDTFDPASTRDLLLRIQDGDRRAADVLFERYLSPLRRWARGRLPRHARDLLDTDDLVQDAMFQTIRRMEWLEPRHEGALLAYLRQVVANRIRDELRRTRRRPPPEELTESFVGGDPSPLEHAIGQETVSRYYTALSKLKPDDRVAVVAKIQHQRSYEELAVALGKPTPDAARMAAARALVRLAKAMADPGEGRSGAETGSRAGTADDGTER